jgi:hypothetical protein
MSMTEPHWERFAYVAVDDDTCRAAIVRVLVEARWRIEERRSGFHLLGDLCDVITGASARSTPGLIVLEHVMHGCSGLVIARGLRDLGVQIPIVLIANGPSIRSEHDPFVIVDPVDAANAVARIVIPEPDAAPGSRTGPHPRF